MNRSARAVGLAALSLALSTALVAAQSPSAPPPTAGVAAKPTQAPGAVAKPAPAVQHGPVKEVSPAILAALHPYFPPNTKRVAAAASFAGMESELFFDHDTMTPESLKETELFFEARVRAQRMATILAADLNNDGKVTKTELEQYLGSKPNMTPDKVKASVEQVMKLGKSGTEVTFDDLRLAPLPRVDQNIEHKVGEALLEGNKAVSRAEFKQVVLDAFDTEDANHDGVIQMDEYLSAQPSPKLAPGTPVPSRTGLSPTLTPATKP